MDHYSSQHCKSYFITLTSADDLANFEVHIKAWHTLHADRAILVRESHQDGQTHYHSLFVTRTMNAAQVVTRSLERLYKKHDIALLSRRSIMVKKQTDQVGLFHYLTKDIPATEKPLLLIGWQYTWIKEQCLANLMKMPIKLLKKGTVSLSRRTAVALVLEYAKAQGAVITGKFSFAELIAKMASEGYQFDMVANKYLYSQVMARLGHTRPMVSLVLGDLHFLD